MSATIIDSLLITLGLDGAGVSTGMVKAQKQVAGGVHGIMKLLAPLAGAFTLGRLLGDYVGEANALGKLSARLRADVRDIYAWSQAVESVGGNAGSLRSSMLKLEETLRASQFGAGSSELRQLGIRTRDQNGNLKSSVDILKELARVAENMDPARFERLAKNLGFDAETIRLLQSGNSEIQNLLAKYQELAPTREDADNAKKFRLAVQSLNATFQAGAAILMRLAVPALIDIAEKAAKFINFLRRHERFVLLFFTALATVIAAKLAPAVWGLTKAWLANPMLKIVALVLLLCLALEDLWHFVNGGGSAFEDLLKKMGASPETIDKVRAAVKWLFDTLKQHWPLIVTLIGLWKWYGKGVLASKGATLALGNGFGIAGKAARLFGLSLMGIPIFAIIAALVLLIAHLEEVEAAIAAGREKLAEWSREALGLDPNGPVESDVVQVEHGGKTHEMTRGEARRAFPNMSDEEIKNLPKAGQAAGEPATGGQGASAAGSGPALSGADAAALGISAGEAVSPAISAADAVSPAATIKQSNNHSETTNNINVYAKSDDPKGIAEETAQSQRRVAATANRGINFGD